MRTGAQTGAKAHRRTGAQAYWGARADAPTRTRAHAHKCTRAYPRTRAHAHHNIHEMLPAHDTHAHLHTYTHLRS
jgi:hypothetical protein